jgi:teichuronic acid exporter
LSLKQKTISGLLWSFIENFSRQGIALIFGIILARLLSPREFGLIGMIAIFLAISQSFIDSGFTQALIRKKDCSQADFSTVFYFNLAASIFFYFLLFISAGLISRFFEEPQLKLIIRVVGLGLVINAFSIVQRARLTKRIDFKLQTRITVIASIIAGITGILFAYSGYGVWSLVIKSLTGFVFTSFLLWLWNKWKPDLSFSRKSFREMFPFGYKLLVSGLIDTIYRNIYLLIIGKYFSATELGFYSRADQFSSLPSSNITGVIQRVSYPVLSEAQDDMQTLKKAYKKIVKSTMFITFILMFGMAAIAKPMVIALIGEKWMPSVIYLQLLCFVGIFYTLSSINLDMLNVKGRSDLFLKLEVIKKVLAIPIIVLGIFFGIKILILGMIVISMISCYLNSLYSGRLIGYSIAEQIKDLIPAFFLSVFVNGFVFLAGILISATPATIIVLQVLFGAMLTIGLCELLGFKDYLYLREILAEKLIRRK